tara:strand:- start:23153 stop:24787 length:1635 start_codon:yes stop_codon:yes gene_type:complete
MNILIAHHFSDYWESGFLRYNTSYQDELYKLIDFIENKNIDKIILPLFESHELEDCHYPLIELCNEKNILIEVHEYGYGWRRELDDEFILNSYPIEKLNNTWTYGKRFDHTEEDIVIIEDWQKQLKGHKVYLAGAFEDECITDIEAAFESIQLEYERVEGLIVGSGIKYNFIGKHPDEIIDSINNELEKIQNKIDEKLEEEKIIDEVNDFEELFEYIPIFAIEIEEEINDLYEEYEDDIKKIDICDIDNSVMVYDLLNEIIENEMTTYEYAEKEISINAKIQELFKELHTDNFYDRYNILKLEDNYQLEELMFLNSDIDYLYEEINNAVLKFKGKYPELSNEDIISSLEERDLYCDSDFYFKLINLSIEENYGTYQNILKKKKNYKINPENTFYRGIKIEENNDIEDISINNSDYDCVYISNERDVALNFSQDKEKSVILNLSVEENTNLLILPIKDNKMICIEGIEYNISEDREEYFQRLHNLGFDGCVVVDNYGVGDDIAIFNDNLIKLNNFEIKTKNGWNKYNSIEELENKKNIRKTKVKI